MRRSVPFRFLWGLFELLRSHPSFETAGPEGYMKGLADEAERLARGKSGTIDVPLRFLEQVYRLLESHPHPSVAKGPIPLGYESSPFCAVVEMSEGLFALCEPRDIPVNELEAPKRCLTFLF